MTSKCYMVKFNYYCINGHIPLTFIIKNKHKNKNEKCFFSSHLYMKTRQNNMKIWLLHLNSMIITRIGILEIICIRLTLVYQKWFGYQKLKLKLKHDLQSISQLCDKANKMTFDSSIRKVIKTRNKSYLFY